ncbi:MAG: hypothetical protein JNL67_00465 [Planctomycetaceae bacterium]|nr:hypothetical protein [Planctomycetaceae bacterium]
MKQDVNVYTMMLLASFVALLIGCIALAVEMGRYPFPTPWNSKSSRAATTAQVVPSPLQPWQSVERLG